ncbi:hypothetical protein [Streptomyces sp. NPDC001492]
MARNLDEFAADLNKVTAQVIAAAAEGAKARDLSAAIHNGDAAEARRIASTMSTAQLQRIQRKNS